MRGMPISRTDLSDFAYFMAVARHRSFRKAAQEMGVTPSAVSHALTALEERRGVRLLNRTTRSVSLTAAGEDLFQTITEPLRQISEASVNLDRLRETPAGRVRVNVPEDASRLLLGPVMQEFVDRYPEVEIDISVTNRMVDVIAEGFDAGIRFGGTVPEDMVAQRLSAPMRWLAAASPDYLATFGTPAHPEELKDHRCVGIRLGNDAVYRWEFEREGKEFELEVPGPVTVDESHTVIEFGRAGVGIVYSAEPVLQSHFDSGALVPVLEDWAVQGEGFYMYYSSRRQVPTALRLLVDMIRQKRPLGL